MLLRLDFMDIARHLDLHSTNYSRAQLCEQLAVILSRDYGIPAKSRIYIPYAPKFTAEDKRAVNHQLAPIMPVLSMLAVNDDTVVIELSPYGDLILKIEKVLR